MQNDRFLLAIIITGIAALVAIVVVAGIDLAGIANLIGN